MYATRLLAELEKCAVSAISLKDVGLVCNLPWCMHGENRNAAVDDVHAIFSQHVSNGSAATSVDAAKLSGLELNASVVHNATNQCYVLSISVVGAKLAATTSELVECKTVTHDSGVLDFKTTVKLGS